MLRWLLNPPEEALEKNSTYSDFESAAASFLRIKDPPCLSQLAFKNGSDSSQQSDNTKDFSKAKNERVDTIICHCRQLDNWDCGVACIFMVLRWIRKSFESSNEKEAIASQTHGDPPSMNLSNDEVRERNRLLRELDTISIWSIDLVILLYKLLKENSHGSPGSNSIKTPSISISHNSNRCLFTVLFCSTNLGVDQSYKKFSYYKTTFERDTKRVLSNFQLAKKLNIPTLAISSSLNVSVGSRGIDNGHNESNLTLDNIVNLISRTNCLAIALIDNTYLINPPCFQRQYQKPVISSPQNCLNDHYESINQDHGGKKGMTKKKIELGSNLEPPKQECETPYSGHYIILSGISTNTKDIKQAMNNQVGNQNDKNEENMPLFHKNQESKRNTKFTPPKYCFVIQNPGINKSIDFLTPRHFEAAWSAKGTDQDIIFIQRCS